MRIYPPWNDCQRCGRSQYRWGIFAPTSKAPKVLVLGAAASRASQVCGQRDPLLAQTAGLIAHLFHLKAADVHADVLLACGSSADAHAHEAAACSQRLDDQCSLDHWPLQLVVLLGDSTARLARYAGLLTAAGLLIGAKRVPAVVVRDFDQVGVGPEWAVLGTPRAPSSVVLYQTAAPVLWSILDGHCDGHAWRPLLGDWKRSDHRPTPEQIDDHVRGAGWLSPFKPTGVWPYCVLDIDIHNAIQYARYNETLRELGTMFKSSLYFQSSWTGGMHVYVRLPPGMEYAEGAIWLAEFLSLQGLLLNKSAPGRFASSGPVATRLVEVPLHPPRLPFGLGSGLRGTPDPDKAVARFEKWLASNNHSEFDRARAVVLQRGPTTKRWPGRAAWARTFVHDLEIAALGPAAKEKKLPAGDPWQPYLGQLAPNVRVLVTRGCLAFGTRTATMMRIVDLLAEVVDPAKARVLLRHWVEHREHHSEDIHAAREDVLAFGDRLVDEEFAGRGVPVAAWSAADAAIGAMYAGPAAPAGVTEKECWRAAFFIIRLFFQKRSGCIPIAAEQFGLALRSDDYGGLPTQRPNRNRVDLVTAAMVRLGIIRQTKAPSYKAGRAGEYELLAPYWPPPPTGSPETYQAT